MWISSPFDRAQAEKKRDICSRGAVKFRMTSLTEKQKGWTLAHSFTSPGTQGPPSEPQQCSVLLVPNTQHDSLNTPSR